MHYVIHLHPHSGSRHDTGLIQRLLHCRCGGPTEVPIRSSDHADRGWLHPTIGTDHILQLDPTRYLSLAQVGRVLRRGNTDRLGRLIDLRFAIDPGLCLRWHPWCVTGPAAAERQTHQDDAPGAMPGAMVKQKTSAVTVQTTG